MTDELEDLIQLALDGEASAAELHRLEARVAADPAARRRYDQLARAFSALATASLVEAPHGLTEAILDEVRRSPLPALSGGRAEPTPALDRRPSPPFPWLRLVLPGLASVVAVAALWWGLGGPLWRAPGSQVAGALMSGGSAQTVRFGRGPAVVVAGWNASEHGFLVRFRNGDTPVTIECTSATPGVRVARTATEVSGSATDRLSIRLAPHAFGLVYGVSEGPDAGLTAAVSFPDGRREVHQLHLTGLSPGRP